VSGKRVLVAVLVLFVAAVVTRGIMIIGLPSEERTRRIDERRVQDLQRLSRAVEVYHGRHQALPPSLGDLIAEPGLAMTINDGESGQRYDYRTVDTERYEVCASFARAVPPGTEADFWSHGAGRQCFTLTVKPARP
jgi:hypothetical protein